MTKRFGFTLAEVLITLGIIGVVAAMTIPTLMNSTGQAEFKSGFKKAVSELNQAITMNVALADSDFSVLTGGAANTFATDGSVANMFATRLNAVKTTTGFLSATGELDNGLTDDGTKATVSGAANYTLFLNDGAAIGFKQAATGCLSGTYNANCVAVVDVNGAKKPNKLTNCTNSTTYTDIGTCSKTTLITADRFSIRFAGNQVQPNGNGARYIMYN